MEIDRLNKQLSATNKESSQASLLYKKLEEDLTKKLEELSQAVNKNK